MHNPVKLRPLLSLALLLCHGGILVRSLRPFSSRYYRYSNDAQSPSDEISDVNFIDHPANFFAPPFDTTSWYYGHVRASPPQAIAHEQLYTVPIFSLDTSQSSCKCSNEVAPVCGTDGVISYTYINRCMLECNARNHTNLTAEYDGHCCDYSHCPLTGTPVCDETGKVHQNECFFEFEQCLAQRKEKRYLGMDNNFEKCDCNSACVQTDEPVCDTRGTTHRNLCLYRNAQCFATKRFNITLELDYNGACCGSLCLKMPQPLFPICDNKGKTYDNFCQFYVEQCVARKKQGESLRIAKFGFC